MTRPLEGLVALVTGGNTGIGAATSMRLASDGARVGIAFFEAESDASSLAERLSTPDTPCLAVPCDVTDRASVDASFDEVEERLGAVTVLVNNAGVLVRSPFLEIDEDTWERALQVSLFGAYRCSQRAVPGMMRAGGGSVVNLASELVDLGGTNHAHYVAAKAGVVGLTRALARELGPEGIRVNAVAPGPTRTRMLGDDEVSGLEGTIPLGRVGEPADIAAAVAFLAGPDASWITGQVLGVNGGLVMS